MKTTKQHKRDTSMNVKTCPICTSKQIGVLDSRDHHGVKVRRRECQSCGHRFSSVEISRESYLQLRRAASTMEQVRESMIRALALVEARIDELAGADLAEVVDPIPPAPPSNDLGKRQRPAA